MKIILIVTFSILNGFLLSAQTCDCNKFRTGKFEISNPDGSISQITRSETKQIEKTGPTKSEDKVVWMDDCTFKLIPVSIRDKTGTIGDDVIRFTFIETLAHAYLVRIVMEGTDFVITAKVYEKGYLDYDKK